MRQLFGYDRLGDPLLVALMNDLYAKEWSFYQNHFCPSMKLLSKQRVNSKYVKSYSTPLTPYQRVMASEHIDPQTKDSLERIHQGLNPFTLKQRIEKKLRHIFQYVTVTSNVRQRL